MTNLWIYVKVECKQFALCSIVSDTFNVYSECSLLRLYTIWY